MKQPEYRHEFKHEINFSDYYSLKQRIGAVAKPDPNAGADGRYHIRSLYFDNDDDKALREKLNGLPNREKFRIRLYNGLSDFIRLEKKSKVRGLTLKREAALTREQTESILLGATEWMSRSADPLITEFYYKTQSQRLKPKTLVDYYREAYVYPYGSVRITFDSNIRTGLYSTGVFDTDMPTVGVIEPGVMLMEVKYGAFLPDLIRDVIQTNARRAGAFSKYAVCRIYG